MEKILDGSALTEELGVGRNSKLGVAISAVDREEALQLFTRSNGHGAPLDDELRRLNSLSNLARGGVQCRQVRFTVLEFWNPNTEKDYVTRQCLVVDMAGKGEHAGGVAALD
jgi:hypothetical protein